jgi:hypothetical protein
MPLRRGIEEVPGGATILGRVTRGVLERLLRDLRESPGTPAGVVALAVILFWTARDGATDALVWAPGTLLLVGLLVVVAVTATDAPPGGRAGLVALAAFAAFVGWCFLTILWADVPADAWSGANKTLAYFTIYALFATRSWSVRHAAALLGAYSLGVTVIGLWELHSVSPAGQPTLGFLESRLAVPISYSNANCALYLSAAIPALFLAARKEVPTILRGVFLAAAGVLAELALLCQSRMSLVALPIVLVGYFVLIPSRLRSLVALAAVGVAVALSASRLLEVYEAVFSEVDVADTISAARTATWVSAAALLVTGIAWAIVDRRVELPARVLRAAQIGAAGLAVVAVLSAAGLFLQHYGDPVDRAGIWWDRFRENDYVTDAETPHIVSGLGGAGRYDVWRVAAAVFVDHPVVGAGVDNFSVDFLRERRIEDNPQYPHSIELRMLQQTGLVGSALVAGFMIAAIVAGWASLRRGPPATRGIAGAALLLFAYWLVHGSIDWLWEIPALSAAAFAALGLFVALAPAGPPIVRRWPVWAAAGCLGGVALVSLGSAWLAAREVDAALSSWRASPVAAFEHLDRARVFDPFSDEPDVLGAVIAAQRGEVDRQRALLVRGLERNPHNWYPYLELGLIAARRDDRATALRFLAQARALNPIDATVRFALERVREGDPPSQNEIDRQIIQGAARYTRVTAG